MIGGQLLISTVFVAGLLSFFSPCVLPLLPVYMTVLSSNNPNNTKGSSHFITISKLNINLHLVLKTVVFVFGISTSFIILGFGAGALGTVINTSWFLIVCGLIVVGLGLNQIGVLRFSFLNKEKKVHFKRSGNRDILGTYLLGFSFSFGWTPCIGPTLGAVLSLSVSHGQATYGAFLMFIYALGLLIPFIILSIFSDLLLKQMKRINKHMKKIQVVGGVIIIIMGILLMTNNLNVLVAAISG